jgi:proteic killer suppression protein
MNVPEWKVRALRGDLSGRGSVSASDNWRITFTFDGKDVVVLAFYRDHH